MIKQIASLLIIICLSKINLMAQNTQGKMNALIDSALLSNYILKSTKKNIRINEADIQIIKNTYLPKVQVLGNFSYWDWLIPNKKKILGSGNTDFYSQFSISQKVYDWGKTKLNKSILENKNKLNNQLLQQIKQTIILGVTQNYIQIQKQRATTQTIKNSIELLSSQLNFINQLYKIGKASQVDLLRIKMKILEQEKLLKNSLNKEKLKLIEIKNTCYLKNLPISIKDTLMLNLAKNYIGKTLSYKHIINQVYTQNPYFKSWQIQKNQEIKRKELYQLENRPQILSFASTSWEDGYLPFKNNFNFNIGVSINYTIPYWGGKSYKLKMLKSQINLLKLEDEKNNKLVELNKQVELLLNNWNNLQQDLISNFNIIKLSNQALQNAIVQYKGGQGNLIDVLDAETMLTKSKINYQQNTLSLLEIIAKLNYLYGNQNKSLKLN